MSYLPELHLPGDGSYATYHYRMVFLASVAELAPDVLRTLEEDVYPAWRAHPPRNIEPEAADLAEELEAALGAWQRRWSLMDDWCRAAAVGTLARWHRLARSGDPGIPLAQLWPPPLSRHALPAPALQPFSFSFPPPPHIDVLGLRRYYEQRCRDAFEKALVTYLAEVKQRAREAGFVDTPQKYADQHFDWLVRWQVLRRTHAEIADEADPKKRPDPKTVQRGCAAVAKLIGLSRR